MRTERRHVRAVRRDAAGKHRPQRGGLGKEEPATQRIRITELAVKSAGLQAGRRRTTGVQISVTWLADSGPACVTMMPSGASLSKHVW